ncbi:MAG: MBL fold metallo-hydrolase [Nitrososphaeria archaeon]
MVVTYKNIIRIVKGTILRTNYGTLGASTSTLIHDVGKNILVDVGHYGTRLRLEGGLKINGLSPNDIDCVILTHINWDHCANIDLFDKSEIFLHKREWENGNLFGKEDLATKVFKRSLLEKMKLKLIDEDMFEISENVYTLNTFGHTIGHISVLVKTEKGNVIISGDAIPYYRTIKKGYPDIIFYDKEEAKKSVNKVRELHPAIIIPGHGPPFNEKGYVERDEMEIRLVGDNGEDLVFKLNRVGEGVATGPFG